MSNVKTQSPSSQPFSRRLFLLLGSMDLAITLLLALAIASIIGTLLQQNQPYADYIFYKLVNSHANIMLIVIILLCKENGVRRLISLSSRSTRLY